MKNKLIAIMILLGLLLRNPIQASARTGSEANNQERNTLIQVGQNEAIVTFGELGFQETSLVSPFELDESPFQHSGKLAARADRRSYAGL